MCGTRCPRDVLDGDVAARQWRLPAESRVDDTPVWEPGKFPLTLPPRVAFDGDLWMTAQTVSYSSPDGLTWTEHQKTDWGERIYEAVVFFQGKLWMYGGLRLRHERVLERHLVVVGRRHVGEGRHGRVAARAAHRRWSCFRTGCGCSVVPNHVGADKGTDGFVNDVWVSDDGLQWTEVTSAAPWSPRAYPGVVALDDALYMLGGEGLADVWQTSDGKQWTEVNPEADWKPRFGFGRLRVRRQPVGVRRVDRRRHDERGERRVVLDRRRRLATAGRTRHRGRREARCRSSSTTASGSSAASTPARRTTGAATSGRWLPTGSHARSGRARAAPARRSRRVRRSRFGARRRVIARSAGR